MNKLVVCLCVIVLSFISCNQKIDSSVYEEKLSSSEFLIKALKNLSTIIVHDIFSPPVASRVYVYPCVAAYEIMAKNTDDYNMLAGQLEGLDSIPDPKNEISYSLAAVQAFNEVGQELIFSEAKMLDYIKELNLELDSLGIPKSIRDNSLVYAKSVARHIMNWASNDNYKESRSFPKHPIVDKEGTWKPTPPAYLEGIEPHWKLIRPMVIKSSGQFKPNAAPEFDMTKGSDFYNKTQVVYDAVKYATDEHKLIASFWDCNPYVMNQTGHVMIATKKITPGGHWMGIASIAARDSKSDVMRCSEILCMTSLALFDGFISCWEEKYRSNLIRPETVINEHIDNNWKPILQTPPFPEHTSGHSVISGASAVILTSLLGDNFAYTDDVELEFGLPLRSFNSFYQASDEAAISRLYGGIHYMPAIDDGVKQGREIGKYIVSKIKTQKTSS